MKRSHIVSATYLESFAVDRKVTVRQVIEGLEFDQDVENVAIRRYAYRRERPDGTTIDDIEWMLSENESAATPILRSLRDRWPLDDPDKLTLATLFAYQMIRGPRWEAEYAEAHPKIMSELIVGDTVTLGGREIRIDQETVDRIGEALASKSYRLMHIVQFVPTLVSLLGTMHWTLVEFASPSS